MKSSLLQKKKGAMLFYFMLWSLVFTSAYSQDLNGSFESKFRRYQKGEDFTGTVSREWNEVAWKGDRVHTQILLWSSSVINNITYEVGDLRNGDQVIASSYIKLRFMEYIKGDPAAKPCDGYPSHPSFVEIAEALSDAAVDNLDASDPLKIWLTIDIPPSTLAGTYTGRITVSSAGAPLVFTITLEVAGFLLPPASEWSFHLDLWQFPQRILDHYNAAFPDKPVTLWSDEHFALFKQAYRMLADLGQKSITTHIKTGSLGDASMIKWVKKSDASWEYDFHVFDKYVDSLMHWGISKQINCFSPIGWNKDEIPYWDETSGSMQSLYAPLGSATYTLRWNHFLTAFRSHLQTRSLFGKTVLYMDEVLEDEMNAVISMIRSNNSNWKIGLAHGHAISNSIQSVLYDQSGILGMAPSIERENLVTTFYTSCTQEIPNNYVTPENSPAEMTWMAWYARKENFNGYLRWAYDNWLLADLSDLRDGSNTAGDFSMVYRKNNSGEFRRSIRTELLREGIQDYEKISILRNTLTESGEARKQLESMIQKFTVSSGNSAITLVPRAQQLLKDIVTGKAGSVTVVETAPVKKIESFPNPVAEEINIQLTTPMIINVIEISSAEGKSIVSQNYDNKTPQLNYTINTANLKKGIYLIRIKTLSSQYVVRFVKQ